MLIKTLFPSMFHRRLLLLGGLVGVSVVPLAFRLSRLTIASGAELRTEAESRLVRSTQTPTVRGSVLDRKGRILAQDRPSYDVAVAYTVITGQWATEQAMSAARRYAGAGWADLKTAQRKELADRFYPALFAHLGNAWTTVSQATGTPKAELDKRCTEVIRDVDSRRELYVRRFRERELRERVERGDDLTPAILASVERRVEQARIAEQKRPHVIVRRVPDDVGFSMQTLASEEVELEIPDPYDRDRPPLRWKVERIPGLQVIDGGDRDYPFESVAVSIDRSLFPTPLKNETPLELEVDGVACHVLGTLRDRLYGDDYETIQDPVTGETSRTDKRISMGDATLRASWLESNAREKAAAFDGSPMDRGAYREGERIGDTGIERSQENYLRGLRGLRTLRLDTGERVTVPATKGRDVHLTLDILLQARIQGLMSPEAGLAVVQPWHGQESITQHPGEWLHGAAVVLDIDTGDLLAMVSTPTFTRHELKETPETIFGDPLALTHINRTVARPYQPGSIVKPLILVGAAENGVFRYGERIACTGHLFPNQPNMFRCWIYKRYSTTHSADMQHDPDASEAIMASCNIFFFTLGRRLGVKGIGEVYREFGVERTFDLGLVNSRLENTVYPGRLTGFGKTTLELGDATQMGIGQGPVAWTPLHAADAYASLARGGVRVPPRLVQGRSREESEDLNLDGRMVSAAMEGLQRAVSDEKGTGHHVTVDGHRENIFNVSGVKIWGKTGTATASDVLGDPDGEGPMPRQLLARGDHSWFVIMVGRDRPQYVISVVIDYGGSGGKVSGPLANQIIAALIAEGYL